MLESAYKSFESYIFGDDEEKDGVSQASSEKVGPPLKTVDTDIEMMNNGVPSTEEPSTSDHTLVPLDRKEVVEVDLKSTTAHTELASSTLEKDETTAI